MSLFCFVVVFSSCAPIELSAQSTGNSDKAPGEVVISKLSSPYYPPLARQARITGDVQLVLSVRKDGSVQSTVVVSGHPMLRKAAQESAQQSQFDCRSCKEAVTPYQMIYSFQLGETRYCAMTGGPNSDEQEQEPLPRVTQSENHVTIFDRPVGTCDPEFTLSRKVRSVKCLY